MRSNGDAAKDPSELEREVNEQRREIGETMHALEEKFSSREMYNQATGYLRDHGGEFAESFGNSIKANPLPVALTSIGLIWMMMGQRRPGAYQAQRGGDMANDLYGNNTSVYGHKGGESGKEKLQGKGEQLKGKGEELKGKAASARQRARESSQEIRERAAVTGQRLRGSAGHAREGLSHSMDSARTNFEHYMREQPLAIGALGIALGALVGASIPRTQAENRAMGDISERAKSKASEAAEKGYEKANEMGESVRREAQETRHSQQYSEHQPSPTSPTGKGPTPTP